MKDGAWREGAGGTTDGALFLFRKSTFGCGRDGAPDETHAA